MSAALPLLLRAACAASLLPPPRQLVVVLVGVPGSGKSTFSERLLERAPPPWARISQDKLGTRKRCLSAARAALAEGANVLIDRCNFDATQRSHWLSLRPREEVRRVAVFLDVPMNEAYRRVVARPRHEGRVDADSMSTEKLRSIVRRMCRELLGRRSAALCGLRLRGGFRARRGSGCCLTCGSVLARPAGGGRS